MCRRLIEFATVVSLILCLAMAALWIGSYGHGCALRVTKIHGNTNDSTWSFCYRISSEIGCVHGETYWHTENGNGGYRGRWNSLLPESDTEGVHLQAQPMHLAFHNGSGTGMPRDLLGFGFLSSGDNPFTKPSYWEIGVREFFVPAWSVCLLFALLPLLGVTAFIRSMKRLSKGACPRCSYNLTGNTSGVCPECGTPTGELVWETA